MPTESGALWMRRLPYVVTAGLVLLIACVLIPAIQQARDAARRTQSRNNLKQIGLALYNYADTFQGLPPGGTFHADGRAHHGWMTSTLPYIDSSPIYMWIDFNQPWDSAANAGIFASSYTAYHNPRIPMTVGAWEYFPAHYSANSHVLGPNSFVKLDDIPTKSRMMLVGELRSSFVPWGCPFNNLSLESTNPPDAYGSPVRNGWIVLMADGDCQVLSDKIAPEILHDLSGANLATSDNTPKSIVRPSHFDVPDDALKRRFKHIGDGTWQLDFINKNGHVVRSAKGQRK